MAKFVQVREPGGPEVLEINEGPVGAPGPGEVAIRQTAIGVNFIDVYFRNGVLPVSNGPATLGFEGAGVVTAIGEGVSEFRPGMRVAYAGPPMGGYATERVLPERRLVPVPDAISDEMAAASMLRGLTAHMVVKHVTRISAGTTVLVHAAAGGMGSFLGQWGRHLGATMYGTAGGPDKVKLAQSFGYESVADYHATDFVAAIKDWTKGRGVDVVVDGVGGDVFERSLQCLAPFGLLVSIGEAAAPPPPVDPRTLGPGRSLGIIRPGIFAYTSDRPRYLAASSDLFDVIARGAVNPTIGGHYALEDAAQAHRDLESRRTHGSLILHPAG